MALLSSLLTSISPTALLTAALLAFLATTLLHRLYLHPLSSVPGPLLARLTSLPLYYHAWRGDEATHTARLHREYNSPIVLLAPDELDIADGAALHPIYTAKGGFRKHPCYTNFYIDNVQTIFAALDPAHRKDRVKAIQPMFAPGPVYANLRSAHAAAEKFCARLGAERKKGEAGGDGKGVVEVLNLARTFALDALTGYLFGSSYGGFEEDEAELSASRFVDYFVSFGRFFYLPAWAFGWLFWLCDLIWLDKATARSLDKGDEYARRIVTEAVQQLGLDEGKANEKGPPDADTDADADANKEPDAASTSSSKTLQARLLTTGFSPHETEQNIKCLMFAGTDSTATNLATICWHLARRPSIYSRLRAEVGASDSDPDNPATDLQSLPYLRAVVNEGLRLSMANPTRLPRAVPPGGWTWAGHALPAGTSVGVGAAQLHYNEAVFAGAREFRPERWLDEGRGDESGGAGRERERMHRDHVPFGVGARMCIARNLAVAELLVATWWVGRTGVLQGLGVRGEDEESGGVRIKEWFNAHVVGAKVELVRVKE